MDFVRRRFARAPEGTAALFFIQIFSTLGFAVFYSTLVLYATKHLHLNTKVATTLMGAAKARTSGRHTKLLSRKVTWPFAPVVVRPLASRRLASVQVRGCGKTMMLRHEEEPSV